MHQANGEFYAAIPDFLAIPMKVSFGLELLSYRLAQCYAETGQFEKAIEELSKIEKDYSNGNYYFFLSGASRAAVYPRALYLMGTLHEKKGDKKLAAEYYQRLLARWRDAAKDLPELVDTKSRLAKLRGVAAK